MIIDGPTVFTEKEKELFHGIWLQYLQLAPISGESLNQFIVNALSKDNNTSAFNQCKRYLTQLDSLQKKLESELDELSKTENDLIELNKNLDTLISLKTLNEKLEFYKEFEQLCVTNPNFAAHSNIMEQVITTPIQFDYPVEKLPIQSIVNDFWRVENKQNKLDFETDCKRKISNGFCLSEYGSWLKLKIDDNYLPPDIEEYIKSLTKQYACEQVGIQEDGVVNNESREIVIRNLQRININININMDIQACHDIVGEVEFTKERYEYRIEKLKIQIAEYEPTRFDAELKKIEEKFQKIQITLGKENNKEPKKISLLNSDNDVDKLPPQSVAIAFWNSANEDKTTFKNACRERFRGPLCGTKYGFWLTAQKIDVKKVELDREYYIEVLAKKYACEQIGIDTNGHFPKYKANEVLNNLLKLGLNEQAKYLTGNVINDDPIEEKRSQAELNVENKKLMELIELVKTLQKQLLEQEKKYKGAEEEINRLRAELFLCSPQEKEQLLNRIRELEAQLNNLQIQALGGISQRELDEEKRLRQRAEKAALEAEQELKSLRALLGNAMTSYFKENNQNQQGEQKRGALLIPINNNNNVNSAELIEEPQLMNNAPELNRQANITAPNKYSIQPVSSRKPVTTMYDKSKNNSIRNPIIVEEKVEKTIDQNTVPKHRQKPPIGQPRTGPSGGKAKK